MSFNGLAGFVSFLESRGDLARVKCRVDPVLEITEIADRMVKNGGKAILFEDTMNREVEGMPTADYLCTLRMNSSTSGTPPW